MMSDLASPEIETPLLSSRGTDGLATALCCYGHNAIIYAKQKSGSR